MSFEPARKPTSRARGVLWPGLALSVGFSLGALSLGVRGKRSATARLAGRLAAAWATATWANLLFFRPWQLYWGATHREVLQPMPGDDLVRRPLMEATRAVTIDAPARAIWPWLVQMGYRRAGWYSADRIDNAGIPSAERIIPELQHLRVGDLVPTSATGGFTVEAIEPSRSLVLGVRTNDHPILSSTLLLAPVNGHRTRLIVRLRMTAPLLSMALPLYLLMDSGDFFLTRRMMLGIKRRAEREWARREAPDAGPRTPPPPATRRATRPSRG